MSENDKLKGHALYNYKMIKKLIDSGISDEDLDEKLLIMAMGNRFKGGPTMLLKSYKAICRNFTVNIPGFKIWIRETVPGITDEDILANYKPSPSSNED